MTFEVAVVGTMGEEEERRGERKEHYNSTKVYLTASHQQEGRKHPNILGKGRPFKKKTQKTFCLSEGVIVDNLTFVKPIKPDLQI